MDLGAPCGARERSPCLRRLYPPLRRRQPADTTQFSVAGGSLGFDAAPNLPPFAGVTLNGQSQTSAAHMSDWAVTDGTGSGSGWNVTVQGDNGAGKSAVFKEYCTDPAATNGCDTAVAGGVGPGYVTSSPADARRQFAGAVVHGRGVYGAERLNRHRTDAPVRRVVQRRHAIPVKIGSGAVNAGMGNWRADTYGVSSASPGTADDGQGDDRQQGLPR